MFLRLGYYLPMLVSMPFLVSGKKTGLGGSGGLKEVFGWSHITFRFPSKLDKDLAQERGTYRPENCLPLGIEIWGGRLFISLPKWRPGVPATLATVPIDAPVTSPPLEPYPNWSWHSMDDCNGLVSVFRMSVDQCDRLWVLDSGTVDIAGSVKSVCPAQILLFDLRSDRLLHRYRIPKSQTLPGSLLTNIVVDVRGGDCRDTFAYVGDVFRYGLIVYSLLNNKSWRIDHPYFFPDPLVSRYSIDGVSFTWTDGVFGLALSPAEDEDSIGVERKLYFHPLSSFREFSVPVWHLRNETNHNKGKGSSLESHLEDPFQVVGEPRRKTKGQASGSAIDRNGVLFYNMISRSAVGCWNSFNGDHRPGTHGLIDKNETTLSFPNDLKIDSEKEQGLWVLSNRLHRYLYSSLSPEEVNFRVLTAKVSDAIKGTPCEPGFLPPTRKRLRNKCQDNLT